MKQECLKLSLERIEGIILGTKKEERESGDILFFCSPLFPLSLFQMCVYSLSCNENNHNHVQKVKKEIDKQKREEMKRRKRRQEDFSAV